MADLSVSRITLASSILRALFAALGRVLTSPFKGVNGSNTYFKDVALAAFRAQLGSITLAEDRYIYGTTTPSYLKHAEDAKFTPESLTLPSGVEAHWIGSSSAKKVIVYFHGGGYVLGSAPGALIWLTDLQKSLGSDVSIILLAYTLAPEARYPTQLKQAVELLRHLVETQGRSPSDLIIAGDSAGGNLSLGVLSHLAHPHPEIPPFELPSKLSAALLISPWSSFNTYTPAFGENAERDMFDGRTLSRWSTAFLGTSSPFAGDFYNEPVLAPPSWWEPIADLVDEVLIWGGGNEILIDGIKAFANKFTLGFGGQSGRVNTVITPKACHEEMIVERILGYKGDSGTGSHEIVEGWVRARL